MKKFIALYNEIDLKLFKYRFEGIDIKIDIFEEYSNLSI